MKKLVVLTVVMVMTLALAGLASAQDLATKDECVAKSKEAAALFKDQSMEEAIKVLNDKAGPFVWKDSYVFALNLDDNKVIAHAVTPALIGKDLMALKDVNGKMFFAEFVNVAKDKGEGWVDYMWPKPGDKTPVPKITYVFKVPDFPVAVAAGIYE
jgi:signal transduction histidine kinase